ncbi:MULTISPECIES: 50S ribosomal protein L17 [unclassified Adlercreutzia]|uniref:50S ribosomal protein L17 n=1 Tax=unclassified Adlercreutzia TaxID=2636013 RepID=UPI0013EB9007|nr:MULTISPECIES: 50S ribosomal protein L17 [unclassified Adlercreutzia]
MRHYKKGRKLGTDWSHTKAMKRSLVAALFLNDRIKTVESRAKEIRPDVDKIITWAKRGDLHSRRLAIAYLNDKDLVREIFEKVEQGMFKDRPGGYTRIMKLGNRKGDNAPMVIMELVTEPVKFKADAEKAEEKPAKAKKAAPKKVEEPAEEPEAEEKAVEAEEAPAEEAPAEEAAEAEAPAEEAAEAEAEAPAEEKAE